jgi:Rnl2 family RNA ligase
MSFNEYQHMENDYKFLKLNDVKNILSDNTLQFVALEKIHGTNFSFICDGINVLPCRRTDILKLEDNFFNYQTIFNKYKKDVMCLFEIVKNLIKDKFDKNITQIQLYGELYGGLYPNVKKIIGSKMVQKGIYYSNTNDFMAFDIKYKYIEENKIKSTFLDWDYFLQSIYLTSIPIVPILLNGGWDEISKLNPKFESIVYKKHNLPKIDNNFSEGFVIKPTKEIIFGEDNTRLIWKFKNPSFLEIISTNDKKISTISPKIVNSNLTKLEKYVNENRYNNIKAKVLEDSEVSIVIDLFYNDIWNDFVDDIQFEKIELKNNEEQELKKKLKGFVNKFVRSRYKTINHSA